MNLFFLDNNPHSRLMMLVVLLFFAAGLVHAQRTSTKKEKEDERIYIENGSFEGIPHDAVNIDGWESCGYNSTPDLLPGPWGVYQKPTDGNTFLGLISREDNTYEIISTKLKKALKKEHCYSFKVDLSRSPAYAGYSGATCLRVWGANTPCEKIQLLATSPVIEHYEWKTYNFSFFTKFSYQYIIIECYYKTPTLLPYRGNILVDSFFFFESCERA